MTWLLPPKQKTSKQAMPPKTIAQDPVASRLKQLDEWLQARTISAHEHAALRAQALGLPPPNAPAPTQVVQAVVEDSASKAEREVKSMVESLIGTLQAPMLAGEAWLVFVGESGSGHLRDDVVRICTASPQRRAFAALFRQNGAGTTPPCLTGDTPTHVFARHGAREFLRRLALSVTMDLMLAEQPGMEKERTRRLLERVLDQDDNQRLANGLLTSISKIRTAEDALVRKTVRDGPSAAAEAAAPKYEFDRSVVCRTCNKRGHVASHCPQKDKEDPAGDGKRPRTTTPVYGPSPKAPAPGGRKRN